MSIEHIATLRHHFRPVHHLVTALATLPAPGENTRFFGRVLGIEQILIGLTMLLLPPQLEPAAYNMLRPYMGPVAGIAFLLCGLALLLWQLLPMPLLFARLSLLLSALTFGTFLLRANVLAGSWIGTATYVLLMLLCIGLAFGLEGRLGSARDPLTLAVLLDLTILGALLLTAVNQFKGPVYATVQPHLSLWCGVMFLAAMLLAGRLLWPEQPFTRFLPAIAAALVVAWNYAVYISPNSADATLFMSALPAGLATRPVLFLTLSVAARPFVPPARLAPPRSRLAAKLVVAIFVFTLVLLAPAATVLLQQGESIEREAAQQRLLGVAENVGQGADATVDTQMHLATTLAGALSMQRMDPDSARSLLKGVTSDSRLASLAAVTDTTGRANRRAHDQPGGPARQRRDRFARGSDRSRNAADNLAGRTVAA